MDHTAALGGAGLPLYLQVKELLLREISLGRWLPKERLPTEAMLASELGVAVGTLRKALSQLESEGLVQRRQGSGTYLTEASKGQAIYHFFHLELINSTTDLPQAELISLERIQHPEAAQTLYLSPETPFWRFRRIRSIKHQPIAVEAIHLPVERAPELDPECIAESLYWFYREHLRLWISRVDDSVSVAPMPEWGKAAMPDCSSEYCGHIKRIAYDQNAQRCEFSHTWFNPQRACYTARWR